MPMHHSGDRRRVACPRLRGDHRAGHHLGARTALGGLALRNEERPRDAVLLLVAPLSLAVPQHLAAQLRDGSVLAGGQGDCHYLERQPLELGSQDRLALEPLNPWVRLVRRDAFREPSRDGHS